MVDKVSEEVEVGKKRKWYSTREEKESRQQEEAMQVWIYIKAVGIYLCMEVSICECMGMYICCIESIVV